MGQPLAVAMRRLSPGPIQPDVRNFPCPLIACHEIEGSTPLRRYSGRSCHALHDIRQTFPEGELNSLNFVSTGRLWGCRGSALMESSPRRIGGSRRAMGSREPPVGEVRGNHEDHRFGGIEYRTPSGEVTAVPLEQIGGSRTSTTHGPGQHTLPGPSCVLVVAMGLEFGRRLN